MGRLLPHLHLQNRRHGARMDAGAGGGLLVRRVPILIVHVEVGRWISARDYRRGYGRVLPLPNHECNRGALRMVAPGRYLRHFPLTESESGCRKRKAAPGRGLVQLRLPELHLTHLLILHLGKHSEERWHGQDR